MNGSDTSLVTREVRILTPTARDGAEVWRLVRDAGGLDLNAAYAYLLLCDRFADSSRILRIGPRLVGALLGIQTAARPDTLFVWQVAVDRQHRGRGIGRALLNDVVTRNHGQTPRFVEAHVGADNHASQRLFHTFARSRAAEISVRDDYRPDDFPVAHAAEQLLRIGPLN